MPYVSRPGGGGGGGSTGPTAGELVYTTRWAATNFRDVVANASWANAAGAECYVTDAGNNIIQFNPQLETDGATAVGTNKRQGSTVHVAAGDFVAGFEYGLRLLDSSGNPVDRTASVVDLSCIFVDGQDDHENDDWWGHTHYLSGDFVQNGDIYEYTGTAGADRFAARTFAQITSPANVAYNNATSQQCVIERSGTSLNFYAGGSGRGLVFVRTVTVTAGACEVGFRWEGFSGETDKIGVWARCGLLDHVPGLI